MASIDETYSHTGYEPNALQGDVIVLGVLGKPFVGEERRRGQELCVGLDRSRTLGYAS